MKKKTISALMVAPGEHPCEVVLCCCKDFLDLAVSFGAGQGCKVSFKQLSEHAGILYNQEASCWDLRGNRKIGSYIFAGVFYIVGVEQGKLASLSDDLMERYMVTFWEPETYTGREVHHAFWDNWKKEVEARLQY